MGLPCFPFILLELFMSLNACSDIKWAYLVFLSYFWNYSCPLMHAWILNGLTLFSFPYFWKYSCLSMHSSDIEMGSALYIHLYFWNYSCPLLQASDIKWA